ncbi:MAG: putative transcriptional regulator, family [Bryobacterales bacterium]|nr:putative transcriptional regulator, family [Bryobacterales bacterium]
MNPSESAEMKNKEYRHGLVNAQIEIDLPLQIRALRKKLVGTQPDLAQLTGMKQSRISAMEKPGGVHFTLETLKRLAEAFDVALVVRFAPFSELIHWSDSFDPDSFQVASYEQEIEQSKSVLDRYSIRNYRVPAGTLRVISAIPPQSKESIYSPVGSGGSTQDIQRKPPSKIELESFDDMALNAEAILAHPIAKQQSV